MLRSRNGIETTNLIFIGNVSGFYKKGKPPMVFTWQRAGGQALRKITENFGRQISAGAAGRCRHSLKAAFTDPDQDHLAGSQPQNTFGSPLLGKSNNIDSF
jgi:hypothetical protein